MKSSIALLLAVALSAGQLLAAGPAEKSSTPQQPTAQQEATAAGSVAADTPDQTRPAEPAAPETAEPDAAPRTIVVHPAVVTLIEQVEVPSRVAGVLAEMAVREGTFVEKGEMLAHLVDDEARLNVHMAGLELRIARRQADNDIRVRFARKSAEVAAAELNRSMESVRKYRKSISDTEIDRLQLAEEQSRLEIEQSEEEFNVAKLTAEVRDTEEKLARLDLVRRRIEAPIAGVVVQIHRRAGEWVEPGATVVRILRVNRLKAEGFVAASQIDGSFAGQPVTLSVPVADGQPRVFQGKLVFVSPEVNPVNGQVRVWAEIENPNLQLRPGEKGTLNISLPPGRPDRRMAGSQSETDPVARAAAAR
ncbi:MAG: efflux RND transporter periplasmic adaptor subunit [Planctomycetaceae bacterium]|nr:efflux RND transporter periplasmic adaptor subunit [Planctomycetaceae bacterium]